MRVLRELGVPLRGARPRNRGVALLGGAQYRLPGTFDSLLTTGLLSLRARGEVGRLMLRLRGIDAAPFASMTARAWIDENTTQPHVRELLDGLFRLATYSAELSHLSAAAALRQVRLGIRHGVLYIDEGWQKIVDSLHSAALASGVAFITSSQVVAVTHDGSSARGVELGGLEAERDDEDFSSDDLQGRRGTKLLADAVVLAVDPRSAASLLHNGGAHAAGWQKVRPVMAACFDVALSKLPRPRNLFALGLDAPLYMAVHSSWAQLTPRGGALIHTAHYSSAGDDARTTQGELEALLDTMQPGWRDVVVHRRYLLAMTVSNALHEPQGSGMARPGATQSGLPNVFLAGDWVGDEGMLSDAALASAQVAARAVMRA